MKSGAFPIIAILVAIALLLNIVISLLIPITRHYWQKYQRYQQQKQRTHQFYQELKLLLS